MSTSAPISPKLPEVFSFIQNEMERLEAENAQLRSALAVAKSLELHIAGRVVSLADLIAPPVQAAPTPASPAASADAAPSVADQPTQAVPAVSGGEFLNSAPGEPDPFAGSVDTIFPAESDTPAQ